MQTIKNIMIKWLEHLNPASIKTYRKEVEKQNLDNLSYFINAGFVISLVLLLGQVIGKNPVPEYGHMIELTGFFLISLAVYRAAYEDIQSYATGVLYLWIGVTMMWMIFLNTAFNPTSENAMVPMLMLALPALIVDAPFRIYILMTVVTLADIWMELHYKSAARGGLDIIYLLAADMIGAIMIYRSVNRRITTTDENHNAKTKAVHDALTGLYNRGGGDQLIRESLKSGNCGSFILMDIDDFKHVNDQYGHGRGDEVLQEVANVLKNQFRRIDKEDIVMRMGGDEFIVYAINMLDVRSVEKKLQEIEDDVHKILLKDDGSDVVSVSMGCVINLGSYPSYEAMYAAADSLLYKTKKNGKNGFCVSDMDYRPLV